MFYKYIYTTNGQPPLNNNKAEKEKKSIFSRTLEKDAISCAIFCEEFTDINFYIIEKQDDSISIVCIYNGKIKDMNKVDKKADELIRYLNIDMILFKRQELTLANLFSELGVAHDNNFIDNVRDVREKNGLSLDLSQWFREKKITTDNNSKDEIIDTCKNLVVEDELIDEINRIYQPKVNDSFAVPVQYMLNITNNEECDKTVNALISSLRANDRSVRDVYSVVNLVFRDRISALDIDRFYRMNLGGIVVIRLNFRIVEDDLYSEEKMTVEWFANAIKHFSTEVTTIICCNNASQEMAFKERLKDVLLIQIKDTAIKNDHAKQYLYNYANKLNMTNISGLLDMVEEDISYKANDLITIFNKWYKGYVKNVQYPQYSYLNITEDVKQEKKETNEAYDELNNLIGLKDIKQTIKDYINYARLQKACELEGGIAKNTCRHMCFVGNPGTAKTTVARYIAQIMKEKGLLSKGKLIEVGRSDIVSRYVGGTAPNVKELFEKADGNVLFIDEAYSLCENKSGMYGDEAINAIVQEMENRRDNMVVIFAGYKNEMEQFLDRNIGLKSRIAHIVEFPDYSDDELMEISEFQANKMDVNISSCKDKIRELIALAKKSESNFGNGRFVRNILEKARMKQASRLVAEDKLFGEHLKLLQPSDFEVPNVANKTIKMGFC